MQYYYELAKDALLFSLHRNEKQEVIFEFGNLTLRFDKNKGIAEVVEDIGEIWAGSKEHFDLLFRQTVLDFMSINKDNFN